MRRNSWCHMQRCRAHKFIFFPTEEFLLSFRCVTHLYRNNSIQQFSNYHFSSSEISLFKSLNFFRDAIFSFCLSIIAFAITKPASAFCSASNCFNFFSHTSSRYKMLMSFWKSLLISWWMYAASFSLKRASEFSGLSSWPVTKIIWFWRKMFSSIVVNCCF